MCVSGTGRKLRNFVLIVQNDFCLTLVSIDVVVVVRTKLPDEVWVVGNFLVCTGKIDSEMKSMAFT
jgi:hypothetical protein